MDMIRTCSVADELPRQARLLELALEALEGRVGAA